MQELISLRKVVPSHPDLSKFAEVSFSLREGEHIAILGNNGSGKTLLSRIILGNCSIKGGVAAYNFGNDLPNYKNIAQIAFKNEYESSDFFYQQRWNSSEYDRCPTVSESLAHVEKNVELEEMLRLSILLSKKIVLLSSGELRRFHLYRVLAAKPRVLIVDNLYAGLDATMRSQLEEIVNRIARDGKISLILLCSRSRDIPSSVTHYYRIDSCRLGLKQEFNPQVRDLEEVVSAPSSLKHAAVGAPIVELNSINITYGRRTLFSNFKWVVRKGERWLIAGANGSGKTTLLSLINGDNPLAYAQEMSLFGRKRGTGESIWDIKRRIGFVSPEMLREYMQDVPVLDVVASGFFDSVGLHLTPSDEQRSLAMSWIKRFGIEHILGQNFIKLSSGEQRLVLVARAFVKDPELLILDEPFYDVDYDCYKRIMEQIVLFVASPEKTLICVSHYPEEVSAIITNHLEL